MYLARIPSKGQAGVHDAGVSRSRRGEQKGFATDAITDDTSGYGEDAGRERSQARHLSNEVFLKSESCQIQIVEQRLDHHPGKKRHAEEKEAAHILVVFAQRIAAQQITQISLGPAIVFEPRHGRRGDPLMSAFEDGHPRPRGVSSQEDFSCEGFI